MQKVVVRIAPEAAAFVRCRRWPGEAHFAERKDGSVLQSEEGCKGAKLACKPANFGWDEALNTIGGAVENTFRQVGSLLLARRLHLNKSQTEIADLAHANQTDITSLERGILPATFRNENLGVEAVLKALEWRDSDIPFLVHMIEEFARIERAEL